MKFFISDSMTNLGLIKFLIHVGSKTMYPTTADELFKVSIVQMIFSCRYYLLYIIILKIILFTKNIMHSLAISVMIMPRHLKNR